MNRNRDAARQATIVHSLILSLLSTRTQAMPKWTPQELSWQLAQLGYHIKPRAVERHVSIIRGGSRE